MVVLRYIKDVVTLQLDDARCIGCGMCIDVCPHAVLKIADKKARIVDRDACMECGACAKNCPVSAISVHSGVGCLTAIIRGAIRGTEPDCDCTGDSTNCC
jgi:ferredoxin